MSCMCPKDWASLLRCFAKLEVWLWLLKAFSCSLKRVANFLPVCPMYALLQSGQVSLYTPDSENLSEGGCLWVSKFPWCGVPRLFLFFLIDLWCRRFLSLFTWSWPIFFWWYGVQLGFLGYVWGFCGNRSGMRCYVGCCVWCLVLGCILLVLGNRCLVYCIRIWPWRICGVRGGWMCRGWWYLWTWVSCIWRCWCLWGVLCMERSR